VEWNFDAAHTGAFANIEPTGKQVHVPGCSFYEYDLGTAKIVAGRVYFDLVRYASAADWRVRSVDLQGKRRYSAARMSLRSVDFLSFC
jgi:hypothetical protein